MQIQKEQKIFDQLYKQYITDEQIVSLGFLLQNAAQRLPDHCALLFENTRFTYQQLYTRAVALSKLLQKKGIKPRDRVLLLIENSPAFYIGCFGIIQMGAVVVPLNIFLKERELAHIIADAKPSLIITSADFMPLLTSANVDLPPVIAENEFPEPDAETNSFKPIALDKDEMAALLYTSGTTGFPKGVMLSSSNILSNVVQGITRFQLQSHDRIFGVLPLFHSFAQNTCIWTSMLIGCTVILVRKIDRRHILNGLQHKPTVFLGVPALYGLLCLLKTADLRTVRCFISGADAMPDKIRAGFELIYRRKICSGYGLTEASPFVSGDIDEETVPAGCVGRPLVRIDVALRDEQEKEVAAGSIGQLWLRGPNVMLGYYNAPEATAAVLHNGWLDTGDLAYQDQKGRLVISGRLKDILKHKGFIIYPPEVENIIMSHPNVIRVGVIGKKDEETGEVPVAFVQIRQEEKDIEKTLRNLCQKNLATYKVPREFFCSIQDLPTTATGKVDKKQLRKQVT